MRRFLVISLLTALGVVITYVSPVTAQPPLTAQSPRPLCNCPEEYDPVCGRNYRTYPNDCTLSCAKELKAYDGKCIRKGTFHTREPQPL